jgi:hypothetical protein
MLPLKGLYGAPLALQDVAEAGYIRFVGVGASVAYVYPQGTQNPYFCKERRTHECSNSKIPRFQKSIA